MPARTDLVLLTAAVAVPDPVAAILDGLRFGVLTEDEEVVGLAEGLLAGPAEPGVVGFLVADDIAPDCQC